MASLNAKPLAFTDSKRLAYALDAISKNTALDLLLDICQQEIGEDASDLAIAEWFQKKLLPVDLVRKSKSAILLKRIAAFELAQERYMKQQPTG